jgi:hypothetical protein
MKRCSVLAFTVGCLASAVFAWFAADLRAQGPEGIHVCVAPDGVMRLAPGPQCPAGHESLYFKKPEIEIKAPDPVSGSSTNCGASIDKVRLAELERQLKNLEDAAIRGELGNRVVAPFEVVDRSGKRVFRVDKSGTSSIAELYNSAEQSVAAIMAHASGGQFSAKNVGGQGLETHFGILASGENSGLRVVENGEPRLEAGRVSEDGTYRLRVYGKGGKRLATIGQNSSGGGVAAVADAQGQVGALIAASADQGGFAGVYRTSTQMTIAALTQGTSGGGVLRLWDPDGKQPMVEAGVDANGIGVVRAGPEGFKPGMGLLGLPSSYISGKR